VDLLGGFSSSGLHLLPWFATLLVVVAAGLWRPRSLHWTVLGSVMIFASLNAMAAVYILNHFDDPRWSPAAGQALSAPQLSSTPLVGQFLGPLDSAMNGVVGGVNDFLAFKHALPIALEFLAASGWALLLAFPLAIVAAGISFSAARRRAAEARNYRSAVVELRAELDQVKLQLATLEPGTRKSAADESHRLLPRDEFN